MFTRDSVIISHNIKTPLTSISRAVGNILQLTYGQLIKSLFSNGEQGFFYDPNDLSTMYQDAAGTIPVTSVGQPVGLVLDKSKGLVLGTELVINGHFDSTNGWTGVENTVFKMINGKLVCNGTTNTLISRNDCATQLGVYYKVQVNVTSYTSGRPRINIGGSVFDVAPSVGIHTYYVRALASTAMLYIYAGYLGTGGTWEFDSVSVKALTGNHAFQTVSASRPILQRNATTGAYYLAFDGADDFLQTNNIDFTATDKVSLFAGVRKLSDAATSVVAELSTTVDGNTGAFRLTAPTSGDHAYQYISRGSTAQLAAANATNLAAPHSAVISTKSDINADISSLRINGILTGTSASDQGTGNYGNHPLYIGRRAGTNLPFNGHLYSLIGIGKLTTDTETTAIEKEIAKRVEVTLNV